MKKIETPRLLLRPFRQEDLEAFHNYARKPNIGIHAGWPPHESMEESQKILNLFIEGGHVYAVTVKENGQLIGSLGIEEDGLRKGVPDCKMLGYVLDEDFWGSGYMTEAMTAAIEYAFDTIKQKLLTIRHYPYNHRSRRVIEKCGFHYDGCLRNAVLRYDGALLDNCEYSMTRREYLLKKAERLGIVLQKPEALSEQGYWDYVAEWGEARMTPFSVSPRDMTYSQWLENEKAGRTKPPQGFVCGTTYFLTDVAGKMLGAANIRHTLNDFLTRVGGHIGYGVRPSCRRKGYAEMMLALALEKCRELGIQKALVTCDDDNAGSAKTIEANGGILEEKVQEAGKLVRRYWIDV